MLALWLRSARPKVEGTIALPGLHTAVTVLRDSLGVPVITSYSIHYTKLYEG